MKNFPIYASIIMLASALITWNAIAIPQTGNNVMKVHILENLSKEEASMAEKIISDRGYKVSRKPLFKESQNTVVITKAFANELASDSVLIEVMHQKDAKSMPKSIFNLKLETKDISEALKKLPKPEELKHSYIDTNEFMPMASTTQQ